MYMFYGILNPDRRDDHPGAYEAAPCQRSQEIEMLRQHSHQRMAASETRAVVLDLVRVNGLLFPRL